MAQSPNITSTSLAEDEGVIESKEAISLKLDEDKVKTVLGTRIEDGKGFYDSKLDLSTVRDNNEKRWLNQNLEVAGVDVYDYQIPYKDNRIFVSVETLTATLVPRIPIPEVLEAQDTEASRELASNYEKVLMRTAQDTNIRGALRMATRHVLIGYRTGIVKTTWDFEKGRRKEDGSFLGGLDVRFVRPHKIIIDADATDPRDIPLMAETLSATVEELTIQFPE